MRNVLKKILNRFVCLVIELQQDAAPKETFFRGIWKRGKPGLEEQGDRGSDQCPVLVVFTGYGVISKACGEKTGLIEKVTGGKEFFWEKVEATGETGERIVFVRNGMIAPLLEKLEERKMTVAKISLSVDVGPDFLKDWAERTYRHWQSGAFWRKKGGMQEILAGLLVRRLRLPVLIGILILSAGGYPFQKSLQERVVRQQDELSLRQREMAAHRAGNEKTQKMIRAFASRRKLAPLLDRIAASVPLGITLELLAVNPPRKRVEPGKPLSLKENYVLVEGYTVQTEAVASFTARLAGENPAWRVMLLRLDRRKEKEDFIFRIGITL